MAAHTSCTGLMPPVLSLFALVVFVVTPVFALPFSSLIDQPLTSSYRLVGLPRQSRTPCVGPHFSLANHYTPRYSCNTSISSRYFFISFFFSCFLLFIYLFIGGGTSHLGFLVSCLLGLCRFCQQGIKFFFSLSPRHKRQDGSWRHISIWFCNV